jgi:ParB family chromosome partitioning protein
MIFLEETVDLARIDSGDGAFRITTRRRTDDIRHSIPIIGLLSPPIVSAKAEKYRIVSGFRRIAACREIGRNRIRARILPEETDPVICVRLAVADNALQRPLNLIEQSRALNLLATVFSDPVQANTAASLFGLPAHPTLVKKILPLCRLPETIQEGVLTGGITLAIAEELQRYEPETAVALVRLFEGLKLGLNRQREVLGLMDEIAGREDTPLLDVLNDRPVQELVSDPETDSARKSSRLLDLLKRRRYPHIYRKADAFQRDVANLKLDSGIHLTPPKHFETGRYTLAVTFSTAAEYAERIESIVKLADHPAFKKLLD